VDHQGWLSNPPYNFGRVIEVLPKILARETRSSPKLSTTDHIPHRLQVWEIDDLTAADNAGRTIEQLSRQFLVHRTTVMAVLGREDVPRRPHGRKLDDQAAAVAVRLYAEGLSLLKIAARFQVDPSTVASTLRRSGVALRPRRGWPTSPPTHP
jgi:lambda repressor-like predicted transcriptional regulator